MADGPQLEYELIIRQQPKAARMCGLGGKADRRPIDPPPIVQLRVSEYSKGAIPGDAPTPTNAFLQNPYYFMFASLASPDSDDELHVLKDGRTRCTTGSVVSSLYNLKDTENGSIDAGFFVFPDLSVRTEGSYRLKLSLFEVKGTKVHHCKSIFSNPFYVYTAKKFPGMEESTPLSCSLADQGIKIRIRKDVRVRKKALRFPAPKHVEEDDEDEDGGASSSIIKAIADPSAEDTRPNKRRATESGKGKGKVSRPTKRPRLVNSDPPFLEKEGSSSSSNSQTGNSYPPLGASLDSSYPSTSTPSTGLATGAQYVDSESHGPMSQPLHQPTGEAADQPPTEEASPTPAATRSQPTALTESIPQLSHQPQDDYYRSSASTSRHPGFLSSSISVPHPHPHPHHHHQSTPLQPQHPSLQRTAPRVYETPHPPPPTSATASFPPSHDLGPYNPLPREGLPRNLSYPHSSINYPNYSDTYYPPPHSLDPEPSHYSYAAPAYPTTDYRVTDSLSRSDRISAPPTEPARESVPIPSSHPIYHSYTQPPVSAAPTPYYITDPRHDPTQVMPPSVSPNHPPGGTHLTYPTHGSYVVRPEQSWPSSSNLLQPPQGPTGYQYRSPPDSVPLQYSGGGIARVDDGRAAGRLGHYDMGDGSDKRPFSSEETSLSGSPRSRNVTLPPLRAPAHPANQPAPHMHMVSGDAHYLPQIPDSSAQYYTPQNHSPSQPHPQHPTQTGSNYRYGNQIMDAGFYAAGIPPPHHPTYGRRVADATSNTSSSGSASVTPRTPIILPPPGHEVSLGEGKKNPLSIGHIVSDRS